MRWNDFKIPRWLFCLVMLVLSFLPCKAGAGAWLMNGSLTAPRALATATLLQNGKVLVVGGIDGFDILGSAELYDPATGNWTPARSLNTSRYGHVATLLQNGKVLVAGGYNGNYLASAELYDPATGTWTFTGSLNLGRYGFTATLMPDGKVLVAGGSSSAGNTTSAELYDPATELWTPTGSLNKGRLEHTATLMPDGKVLVAGGSGNGPSETVSEMELYDPLLGSWALAGPMIQPRVGHTATLLPNGQVLFAGGFANGPAPTPFSSAECYNPLAGTNQPTGALNTGRSFHTATLLPNGTVLVSGGTAHAENDTTGSAEVYDPSSGMWAPTNSLNTARFLHTATLLASGRVLITGGTVDNNESGLTNTEVYDSTVSPATGAWATTGSMQDVRENFAMTLLPDGTVLAVGGENGSGSYYSSAEIYDPTNETWTKTGSLNIARFNFTTTLLPNGKVLAAGGTGDTIGITTTELYDPTTGIWTPNSVMNAGRYAHTATLLRNGKVLFAGGSGQTNTAELYDPTSNTWTLTGEMIAPRSFHKAILLRSGKVLVVGGSQTVSVLTAEIYDPLTGRWSTLGQIRESQYVFTSAVLLANGNVLVVGINSSSSPIADLFNPARGVFTPAAPPGASHFLPSFTLLPDGKALLAGVNGNPEIYDPTTDQWTTTANMNQGRENHRALILPSGKLLVAGGYFTSGLASAELYDTGLGFNNSWRPQIAAANSPLSIGGNLNVTGSGFSGLSEGASGDFQSSPANYPLVQLRGMESGQVHFLPATNWSANSFTSLPLWNFPPGYALATVFVNGIPSTSRVVNISVPTPALTTLNNVQISTNGVFQLSFTNNPGAVLGVLMTTNLTSPLGNWTALGGVTETAPGQFQFRDPQNSDAQRFYLLTAP